jgi:hypothetical protein
VSPYRLLFGAAYSVGVAEGSLADTIGDAAEVPLDLSYALKAVPYAELPWTWPLKENRMVFALRRLIAVNEPDSGSLSARRLDDGAGKTGSSIDRTLCLLFATLVPVVCYLSSVCYALSGALHQALSDTRRAPV